MKINQIIHSPSAKPLIVSSGFLLVIVLFECCLIGIMNSGQFVYTLDDPYIHMALSENIREGHYGVNSSEFSAPSSSILWPFILCLYPFDAFSEYFPLVVNIFSAIGTLLLFLKILENSIHIDNIEGRKNILSLFLILITLGTNMIGLIFTGMEHSLQLLMVTIILWGLISEIETETVSPLFLIAIIIAPLIRYENSSVSLAALFYLFIRKRYKESVLLSLATVLSISGFSIFLIVLGLQPLPTSVGVKSSIIANNGSLETIINHLMANLRHERGLLLSCGLLWFIAFALFSKENDRKRLLASCISISICLHLFMGRFGWYNRYEIYIWSVSILALIYLNGRGLSMVLTRILNEKKSGVAIVFAALILFFVCQPYIKGLSTLPTASNNIYEQQYQMHRFATDYYDKPIAVNDLGYVSYKNDNYVLDLYGLASIKALKHRVANKGPEWMDELAKTNNVEFAMIYKNWFSDIPTTWIKIGDLYLGKRKITPANSVVSFYALNEKALANSVTLIKAFRKTLPLGVTFTFRP